MKGSGYSNNLTKEFMIGEVKRLSESMELFGIVWNKYLFFKVVKTVQDMPFKTFKICYFEVLRNCKLLFNHFAVSVK